MTETEMLTETLVATSTSNIPYERSAAPGIGCRGVLSFKVTSPAQKQKLCLVVATVKHPVRVADFLLQIPQLAHSVVH
jgi:hypothetical protein